jgi:hypothetical protein
LTNFLLLCLGILVALWLGLAVVFPPYDSAASAITYLALVAGSGLLGSVIAGIVQAKLISRESVWLQPVSEGVGTILANSVVSLWLLGIGVLMFVMLHAKRGATDVVVGTIVLVVAGAGLGRTLQKRWSSKSWLAYGISFTAAFMAVLAGLATTKLLRS